MHCDSCGHKVQEAANFCSHCGHKIIRPEHSSSLDSSKDTSQKEGSINKNEDPDNSSLPETSNTIYFMGEYIKGDEDPEVSSSSETYEDTTQKQANEKRDQGTDLEYSSSPETSNDTTQQQTNKTEYHGTGPMKNVDIGPNTLTDDQLIENEKQKKDLRILLVGHTGHGKSATANTLLGDEIFHHHNSHQSVTKTAQRAVRERFGRRVEIVDAPGFFDTQKDDNLVYKELIKCVALTIPGFNAICFVIKPERFSPEIESTVDMFFDFFGEDVEEFAFVILTFTEDEQSKTDYIGLHPETRQPKLNELIRRCKGKILNIDNHKRIPKDEKEKMARKIIDEIEKSNSNTGKRFFTNKMIKQIDDLARDFNNKKDNLTNKNSITYFIQLIGYRIYHYFKKNNEPKEPQTYIRDEHKSQQPAVSLRGKTHGENTVAAQIEEQVMIERLVYDDAHASQSTTNQGEEIEEQLMIEKLLYDDAHTNQSTTNQGEEIKEQQMIARSHDGDHASPSTTNEHQTTFHAVSDGESSDQSSASTKGQTTDYAESFKQNIENIDESFLDHLVSFVRNLFSASFKAFSRLFSSSKK